MSNLRDWLLWNPRRAAITIAAALLVVFVLLSALAYASQVHRYNLAVAKAERQAAEQAAGTDRAWYENPEPTTSPTAGSTATATDGATATEDATEHDHEPGFTEDLHDHAEEEAPAATDAEVAAARSVAAAFVTGWLGGAGGTDALLWSVPLTPLVTAEVASALPLTSLEAIPAATLVETSVTSSSIADVVVRATLSDGTALDVTVSATSRGYLVSDYAPAAA